MLGGGGTGGGGDDSGGAGARLTGAVRRPWRDARSDRSSFVPDVSSSFTLGSVLLATSGLFCLATLYFGTRGGYYDTDDYDGNGTAH